MAKLLPKTVGEFATDIYWQKFFAQIDDDQERDSFEWYADYVTLQPTLDRYLKIGDKILQVGCGNSLLADQLYDNGYRHVTSFDIVPDVVKKQKQRNRKKRPELEFMLADVTQPLTFDPASFNVVIDKGTLDALLPDESGENLQKIQKMFKEIERCLTNGGRYIIVSLAQEIVLKHWISYFTGRCLLRLHQLPFSANSSKHAVFLLITTKLKDGTKIPEMYELVTANNPTVKRCSTVGEIFAATKAVQQYRYFCHKATAPFLEDELEIQLYNDSETEPRYKVILVHKQEDPKSGTPFAVFVVPSGNENGWVYSTPKGRQELCKLANCRRLAVVSLANPSLAAARPVTLNDIKSEMNEIILDFAPSYLKDMKNIPYLSVDTETDTVSKETLQIYDSPVSGRFEIVDVCFRDSTGEKLRQLVFSSNKSTIQSEIRIVNHDRLDWSNLACLHHRAIVAALAISCDDFIETPLNVCLIGLGGGCLATFLRKHFPKASITAVELDPAVVEAAKTWFEFKTDDQLSYIIEDGVKYLNRLSEKRQCLKPDWCGDDSNLDGCGDLKHDDACEGATPPNDAAAVAINGLKPDSCGEDSTQNGTDVDADAADAVLYDVIILDVSGPSVGEDGLTGPPPEFLSDQCIRNIKRLLTRRGALALNLVTRDRQKAADVKQHMSDVFETVLSHGITDMVNELLICLPYKPDDFSTYNEQVQRRLSRLYEYLADICNNFHNSNNVKNCLMVGKSANNDDKNDKQTMTSSPEMTSSPNAVSGTDQTDNKANVDKGSPIEKCQNVNEMLEKILSIT